jgi:hypothetical protein
MKRWTVASINMGGLINPGQLGMVEAETETAALDQARERFGHAVTVLYYGEVPLSPGYPGEPPEGMGWSAWYAFNNID